MMHATNHAGVSQTKMKGIPVAPKKQVGLPLFIIPVLFLLGTNAGNSPQNIVFDGVLIFQSTSLRTRTPSKSTGNTYVPSLSQRINSFESVFEHRDSNIVLLPCSNSGPHPLANTGTVVTQLLPLSHAIVGCLIIFCLKAQKDAPNLAIKQCDHQTNHVPIQQLVSSIGTRFEWLEFNCVQRGQLEKMG
eukprot:Gb_10971 [translate_table: standard]